MSFCQESRGDVTIFHVHGQLVVNNGRELKAAITDNLSDGARKVVLDLSENNYMDSSGLGLLVSMSSRIRTRGGELRIAGLNDDQRTLLRLTKLDTLFHISDSLDDALADFQHVAVRCTVHDCESCTVCIV